MSVEFTLHDSRLIREGWNRILYGWQQQFCPDAYEPAEFSDESPPAALVWGPGSIRGFLLALHPGRPTARFNALASRTDWIRGFHIMRTAVRHGGGWWERESGEIYGVDQLIPEQAQEEARADFLASVGMISGTVHIPYRDFEMPVYRSALVGKRSEVEADLAARVARYATAYRADPILLDDDHRLATWALVPTIVRGANLVHIDWKEGLCVPLERLVQALGPRAETLGEGTLFLPELDPAMDGRLLQRLDETVPVGPPRRRPVRRRR